jgi:radical SAM protein with 4Fe4S-binding SPASM domain
MGRLGVKSIMYAGEGEPFLHKDISNIIKSTKDAGIDVAVTSNGALFNKTLADHNLPYLSWIKVSINAGNKETYARIHRTKPEDFNQVLENLTYANKLRRKKGYKCALGMQIILLPENFKEIIALTKIAKDIGMDYLVVKPYSQHPLSRTTKYRNIKYARYLGLGERLKKFNGKGFQVVFRINTMRKWDTAERSYEHCLALPFWAYIDAGGDVWACSIYLNKDEFLLGNIYKSPFSIIWKGEKRLKLTHWCAEGLDTNQCRINCRMDEINRYLWELKFPSEHANFI